MAGNVEVLAQLRAALHGELPEGLEEVDEATLVTLAAAIREAEERQARALRESADAALRYVPALLRKPVRKAIFG